MTRKRQDRILDAINKRTEKQPSGFWDWFMFILFVCTVGFIVLLLLVL